MERQRTRTPKGKKAAVFLRNERGEILRLRIDNDKQAIDASGVPQGEQDHVRQLAAAWKSSGSLNGLVFGNIAGAVDETEAAALFTQEDEEAKGAAEVAERSRARERGAGGSSGFSSSSTSSSATSRAEDMSSRAPPPPKGGEKKNWGEDDSEEDDDDPAPARDGKGAAKPPASRAQMGKHLGTVISFAAANSSVGLSNVRSATMSYFMFDGVEIEHKQALLALGLSSVGSIKRIWAIDMLQTMKALGTVPGIFVGAGGTYKAFLYLGYDILLHLSQDQQRKQQWPEWLRVTWDNCQRVCPGGDIRMAPMLNQEAKESNKNRNAAIMAAKTAFQVWQPAPELKYVELLVGLVRQIEASVTKGVITKYVKPKEGAAK